PIFLCYANVAQMTSYVKSKRQIQNGNSQKLGNSSSGSDVAEKKTATSLILFEEVDVIFDDDVGFLAAIKAFMSATKRPVILTTNDPLFKDRFDGSLDEIIFKTPSAVNMCSYLQLVCLAEGVQLDLGDVSSLLRLTCGDVRRCLLQLQVWVQSGGRSKKPICVQCKFLQHKSSSKKHMDELLMLLAESWRRGVPLLYLNLELLLSVHNRSIYQRASLTNSKSVSHTSKLSRRKYNNTSSDSLGLEKTFSFSGTPSKALHSGSTAQQIAAKEESECLDALTDFFDIMSYLDATLPPTGTRVSDSCAPESFVWTGAALKAGLLDEMREEEDSSYSQERLLDIQAAAEGLGCHRCLCRASEAWTEVQKIRQVLEDKRWGRLMERLALTSSKRHSLSFSFQPLCDLSQRRFRLNRTVLSSKPFVLLGNRRAVCVDYMPVLRSICRLHKAQQQKQEPLRCMNYLNNIHLGLSKSTMQLLAEGFT
uniref:ATPase family AAA domain-containing protein 5 n=1 Tax=Maylandia zebra TaxID=106582 RepID=A0A3P9DD22_9CICH